MRFASRDLTDQYISASYNDVLQQYPTSDTLYVLDGLGNVVFTLPSASIGYEVITSNITSSATVLSASYSTTSSFSTSASFAAFAPSFAGMISDVSITDNGNNTITVSTGSVRFFTNDEGRGGIVQFSLPESSFSIPLGTVTYVVAKYETGSAVYSTTTNASDVNDFNVIPVGTVSNLRGEIRGYVFDNVGSGLANRIHNRLLKTGKFTRQDGLVLFETGSGFIGVTEGTVWDGATSIDSLAFNSMLTGSDPIHEVYFYWNSASLFTSSFDDFHTYINGYYDDGDNRHTISSSYYVNTYVWRLIGAISEDQDVSIVIGNQYATLNEAKAESVPEAPAEITEFGLLVGRIIAQSGSSLAAAIESAFASAFASAPITNHENLDGLEGGAASEHYHLTQTEYSYVHNQTSIKAIRTVTGNYSVTGTDYTVIATGSTPITLTLPDTSGSAGRIFVLKNRNNFPMYVIPVNASARIDGETTLTASFKNTSVELQCSGSEWFVL